MRWQHNLIELEWAQKVFGPGLVPALQLGIPLSVFDSIGLYEN